MPPLTAGFAVWLVLLGIGWLLNETMATVSWSRMLRRILLVSGAALAAIVVSGATLGVESRSTVVELVGPVARLDEQRRGEGASPDTWLINVGNQARHRFSIDRTTFGALRPGDLVRVAYRSMDYAPL